MKCISCQGNFVGLCDNGLCGYCNHDMKRDKYFENYDESEWFYGVYYVIGEDKK